MLQKPTATGSSGEFPRAFGALALLKQLAHDERTEVFLALRPEGADRLCVVTLLGSVLTAESRVVDAMRAQATWLVGRVHGNLVQIYDVGQVGSELFFVSEYVEGFDLGQLLAQGGALPPGPASVAALELGDAITFVRSHEAEATGVPTQLAGLSAGAVIFARDGKVKLLHQGSGLAPTPNTLAAHGPAVVSLIAPELVDGGGSAAGDIFALGALLWQMLTGRTLAGEDAAAHLASLRSGGFVPTAPSAAAPKAEAIPEALDRLVIAALSPQPDQRPPSFEAFRSELLAIVRALPEREATEHAVRRLVEQRFAAALVQQAEEVGRLVARAGRPLDTGTQPPAQTLTSMSGVRRGRAEQAELVLGETIPGTRYRALDKLGEGGMGAVYLAEHVDIERKVALKILHSELVQNPHVVRQFRQEARAASRIGNPYICDVTDWGEVEDGRVFFVMEFLAGHSLAAVLKRERRLSIARTIPILRQAAKALGAAHEKGIVHLDVKPDNLLLVEKEGREAVKVVDFGIAGLMGQGGGGTKVMGTPEYMAPERARGLSYDHRSDIYSLGVMAWEMLVGDVPIQGKSAVETLAFHVESQPPRMRDHVGGENVPGAIEDVVMRMLEKETFQRPQSMAEVEALLIEAQLEARVRTAWDEDLPLPPMDPEWSARIARRLSPTVRRTRQAVALAGAVAVSSLALAAYFAMRGPVEPVLARTVEESRPRPLPTLIIPIPNQDGAMAAGPAPERAAGLPAAVRGLSAATEEPAAASPRKRLAPAAARDPSAARAAVERGKLAMNALRPGQAEHEFADAVSADGQNVEALAGLAEAQFENARYESALQSARAATRKAPHEARYFMLLGDAHFKLNQYQDALKAYQKALALGPKSSRIALRIKGVKAKLEASAPGSR
jgi:serine/threonine protein kinase/predicted negative regulator of RcsB-dependent stress response